jgi:ATP-dependent DNA helicase RecQ
VIDFLRGSSTTRAEHQSIKTYGIGKDISKDQWKLYLREMLYLGYLQQSDSEYPVLQLNDTSRLILQGEMSVKLIKSVAERKELTNTNQRTESAHRDLLAILKNIRYQIAKEENVAAFQVFSDATLLEMATYLPLRTSDLSNISGFGNLKLVKYGSLFLDPIIDYCRLNGLATKIDVKAPKRQRAVTVSNKPTETKKISLGLFKMGKDIDQIAFERELKRSTIEEHLGHFVFTGELNINEIVRKDKLDIIIKAIEENKNSLGVGPIKKSLGEAYSYGEISAVINYLKRMSEA